MALYIIVGVVFTLVNPIVFLLNHKYELAEFLVEKPRAIETRYTYGGERLFDGYEASHLGVAMFLNVGLTWIAWPLTFLGVLIYCWARRVEKRETSWATRTLDKKREADRHREQMAALREKHDRILREAERELELLETGVLLRSRDTL